MVRTKCLRKQQLLHRKGAKNAKEREGLLCIGWVSRLDKTTCTNNNFYKQELVLTTTSTNNNFY